MIILVSTVFRGAQTFHDFGETEHLMEEICIKFVAIQLDLVQCRVTFAEVKANHLIQMLSRKRFDLGYVIIRFMTHRLFGDKRTSEVIYSFFQGFAQLQILRGETVSTASYGKKLFRLFHDHRVDMAERHRRRREFIRTFGQEIPLGFAAVVFHFGNRVGNFRQNRFVFFDHVPFLPSISVKCEECRVQFPVVSVQ